MLQRIKDVFVLPPHLKWFKDGYANMASQKYQAAIYAFDKSISIHPVYEAYNNRAAAYFYMHDYTKAAQDYAQAIRLEPQELDAYLGLGITNTKLQNYHEALKAYNQLLVFNPYHSVALTNRGYVNLQMDNYVQALKDFDRAIALDSSNAVAYSNRANVYYQLKQSQKAKEDWQKASDMGFKEAQLMLTKYKFG